MASVNDTNDIKRIRITEPVYFKFIMNALTGKDSDNYFQNYSNEILFYSEVLRDHLWAEPVKVYRSVLLDPEKVKEGGAKVLPHGPSAFLSFSENPKFAEAALDPKSESSKIISKKIQLTRGTWSNILLSQMRLFSIGLGPMRWGSKDP